MSTVTFFFAFSQVRSFRVELNTEVTSDTLALVERNLSVETRATRLE